MHVDRAPAQTEFFGDLPRGEAAADGVEDLAFPRGEPAEAAGFLPVRAGMARQQRGGGGAQVDLPGEHRAQGGHERLLGLVLHDIALCAGMQGLLGVEALVVHREHQDRAGIALRARGADPVESAAVAQGKVQHHRAGAERGQRGQAFLEGAGLAADGEIGFARQQRGQALAHDGMVVHQQQRGLPVGGHGAGS